MMNRTNVNAGTKLGTGRAGARRKSVALMLALAPLAGLFASNAVAATYTWDPQHSTSGSAGDGVWDTTTANWALSGADTVWPNDLVSAAAFGGATAGNVTVTAPISVNSILFNATTAGSNYLISATGGNGLTLAGTTPTIISVAGESPTISAPIAGAVGLTFNDGTNTGNLTLTGANTYTGTTTINSGTLIVGPGGTLGAATAGLVVGQSSTTNATTSPTTTPGNLILNNSVTVGSVTSAVNNATASTISITGTNVLTVNGAMTVGLVTAAATAPTVALTVSGNELDLNGALTVGLADSGNRYLTTLDMSGLNTFVMNSPTGAFNVGATTQANATVLLARNNTITAATMALSCTTANAGAVSMTLGNGTNIFNVSDITLGSGKGNAAVKFAAANAGSVVINGTGGAATVANITLSNFTSATPNNSQSNLTLATHNATVNAGTVIIGELAGATGRTANGTITFDTGTFNAQSLQIALDVSGGASSATFGAIGSFVLGTAATSTGVLNVTGSFILGSVTNASTTNATFSNATFTINGGTANIGTNILLTKAANATNAVANSTLNLNGGVLNMMGNSIGTTAAPITVKLVATAGQTATLSTLGGTGINGAGLTMNGLGTLILDGINSYTGTTTVSSGILQVGSGGTTGTFSTGDLVVSGGGSLVVNKTGNATLTGNLTGAGNVTLQGGGTTVFSASGNNFTGITTVSNSTLAGVGTLGALTLNGGLLKPGTSSADGSIGTMSASSLTVTSGELRFDLLGATSDLINVTGAANFTSSSNISVTLAGTLTSGNYTLVTAAGGISGAGTINLATTQIGRTHFALDTSNANNIFLTVTGAPASLVFNGLNSSVWDTQTSANFLNGATQDQFFTSDAVTFNDSNGGHYAVTISGQVNPGSILVNNSAGDYTFTGADANSGIAGIGTLTKSGTGNLTLASNNTRTGDTIINQGGVTVASGGTIASGNITVANGASFTVAVGGNVTSTPNVVDNGTVSLNNPTRAFASLNGSGAVNLNSTIFTVSGGGIFTGTIGGTGSLVVSGSTFQVGNGSSGAVTVGTTVNGGATLAVNLNTPYAGAVTGAGSLQILSSGSQVFSGPVTLTGTTVLTNGGIQLTGATTDTLGAISGANGLIVGDGTTATALTLSGSSTMTGSVAVNAGSTLTLPLGVQIASTSGVTLNGGTEVFGNNISTNNFGANAITAGPGSSTLKYTGANLAGLNLTSINVGANNLTIDINDSNGVTKNSFTYAGVMSGTGNISIINSGTWNQDTYILNSTSNNLTGNLTVGASGAGVRLEVNNTAAIGNAQITSSNGSQFWINVAGSYANSVTFAGNGTPVDAPPFGGIRLNNNVTLSGPVALSGDGSISAGTNGSNQATLSGVISGAHTLTTESGVFTLSNANTYGAVSAGTPGTIVARYNNTQSSTIVLGNANALGVGGLQLAGGGVELNGLSVTVPNLSSTAAGSAVAVTSTADTSAASNSFLQVNSLTGLINGDYVSGPGVPTNTYVTGTATQETPRANATINTNILTLSSVVGLLPGETITGAGIPAGTTITSIVSSTVNLSNNVTAALANTTVTVATGNIVTLNNTLTGNPSGAVTILDGSVISNNGTGATGTVATLTTGSDNSNQTFSGSLVDGTSGGTLAFAKIGTGTQTFTGASTYSGGTAINAGKLLVNNTTGSGTGSGNVTVNGGTLGGSGSVAGSIIPGSGAHTIHPGIGGGVAGTLAVGGDVTTNANTTLAFDLGSPTTGLAGDGTLPNGTSDLLKVTGNLSLNGGSLAITAQASTGNTSLGYYKVVSYSGALTGSTSAIVLPAVANNIAYTLDSSRDPGYLDVHRGYIGDATDDGVVDLNDLNVVLNNLGVTTNSWNLGNFDGASTIDLNDLNAVLNHLGTSIPAGSVVVAQAEALVAAGAPAPEPATLGVAGFAAVAMLLRRKRA